ncbi:phosphomannomutase [Roseivivax halodurans JCM 10272]|uniref:Phosphomannomutase n=1 Tax=Roseivivax halodurans JCM 10272 TaxID=1449350 RepID=X7E4G0_9RHOB|nr:phosphomannomutase [Roseivivax halodurans]ETX10765.1 phosphomannomutase [Roseivivax halodurans JCM 10272]
MAPKFGTSGLRGLVSELTGDLVADHVRAFIAACPTGGGLYLGRDLRESSPRIAAAVTEAALAEGLPVTECGALPTPALALAAMKAGQAAVMVTGSHIPADRNGLKFYLPTGEISKADEAAILDALGRPAGNGSARARDDLGAGPSYVARYADAYGPEALDGWRIGIYQHSSVARDIMVEVVRALGGDAVPLARSDSFIPVDTEALDPATRHMLAAWCSEHTLDAVISTDGDADRPMLADATGRIVPGDVLGVLTARALGAGHICTPVSSNSMVADMPDFTRVERTRIGSPYVIAAMEAALAADPAARVVGYEANGGFLLGFEAPGPAGTLAPLMTRDCLLPILAPLAAARAGRQSLADTVAALPPTFTAADRLTEVPTEAATALVGRLSSDIEARRSFFEGTGDEAGIDLTDGLRVSFANGCVVHLRPSGNAPETRCYAEASSPEAAEALVKTHLDRLRRELG